MKLDLGKQVKAKDWKEASELTNRLDSDSVWSLEYLTWSRLWDVFMIELRNSRWQNLL